MPTSYPHVFAPLTLRHLTLKNRVVFGAHTANMSEEGIPGDRHFGYYRERARGGAAMIVVEPVPVHETASLTRGNFLSESDAVIEPFRRITDEVKSHGTAIIQQLYHVGAHGDWDNSFRESWSPSGLPSMFNSDGSYAMTAAEIEEVIAAHVAAAHRARSRRDSTASKSWQPTAPCSNSSGRPSPIGVVTNGAAVSKTACAFSAAIYDGIRKACGDDFICGLAVSIDPKAGRGTDHRRSRRGCRLA